MRRYQILTAGWGIYQWRYEWLTHVAGDPEGGIPPGMYRRVFRGDG